MGWVLRRVTRWQPTNFRRAQEELIHVPYLYATFYMAYPGRASRTGELESALRTTEQKPGLTHVLVALQPVLHPLPQSQDS